MGKNSEKRLDPLKRMKGIWTCKIGENFAHITEAGADLPMRQAVARAYKEITGAEPEFIFSGWAGELTESERNVVDYPQTGTGIAEKSGAKENA